MRHEVVRLVDDIDGSDAERTVLIVDPDGIGYEIDLNTAHLDEYEDAIAKFIAAARRVGKVHAGGGGGRTRQGGTRRSSADREQNQAIRAWAVARGMKVGAKGRIPAEILEAYHQQAS